MSGTHVIEGEANSGRRVSLPQARTGRLCPRNTVRRLSGFDHVWRNWNSRLWKFRPPGKRHERHARARAMRHIDLSQHGSRDTDARHIEDCRCRATSARTSRGRVSPQVLMRPLGSSANALKPSIKRFPIEYLMTNGRNIT